MESKSTYHYHQHGKKCELIVRSWLLKNNFKIQFVNLKSVQGEIDIVCLKENRVYLIEVKSLKNVWYSFERIQLKQLNILKKNQIVFQKLFPAFSVKSFVAWVHSNSSLSDFKVEWVEI